MALMMVVIRPDEKEPNNNDILYYLGYFDDTRGKLFHSAVELTQRTFRRLTTNFVLIDGPFTDTAIRMVLALSQPGALPTPYRSPVLLAQLHQSDLVAIFTYLKAEFDVDLGNTPTEFEDGNTAFWMRGGIEDLPTVFRDYVTHH